VVWILEVVIFVAATFAVSTFVFFLGLLVLVPTVFLTTAMIFLLFEGVGICYALLYCILHAKLIQPGNCAKIAEKQPSQSHRRMRTGLYTRGLGEKLSPVR
jgi:predicted membrane protein